MNVLKAIGRVVLILIGVLAFALLFGISLAHAQELPRYSAHETLQRAQVGTSSARLAPPVRVRLDHLPDRLRKAAEVERMSCRENPAEPKTIICEPRRGP